MFIGSNGFKQLGVAVIFLGAAQGLSGKAHGQDNTPPFTCDPLTGVCNTNDGSPITIDIANQFGLEQRIIDDSEVWVLPSAADADAPDMVSANTQNLCYAHESRSSGLSLWVIGLSDGDTTTRPLDEEEYQRCLNGEMQMVEARGNAQVAIENAIARGNFDVEVERQRGLSERMGIRTAADIRMTEIGAGSDICVAAINNINGPVTDNLAEQCTAAGIGLLTGNTPTVPDAPRVVYRDRVVRVAEPETTTCETERPAVTQQTLVCRPQ
tara:strand:- start:42 stop:845 length:804 start_codon:yes stop_codon:yes gene_type:complete